MPDPASDPPQITRLRLVLTPRFNMHSLTSVSEPAYVANALSPAPLFAMTYHAMDGSQISSDQGLTVNCSPVPDRVGNGDMIMLIGGAGAAQYRNPRLFSWLRLQARIGAQICGVDSAPYILARAGLLSGRAAVLHWPLLPGFQEQFPNTDAADHLFTTDGAVTTCAGGAAAVDMMLHLITNAHGAPLAGDIADRLAHHPLRAADTPQRVTMGRGTQSLPDTVRAAVDLIENHISEPLSVPEIAAATGLSQRQLVRQFDKVMGCSVVQFSLLMRLQHARVLLISTALGIREISTASGFNSLSHFDFAFKKCFGQQPGNYRATWHENAAEPEWPAALSQFLDEGEARKRAQNAGP